MVTQPISEAKRHLRDVPRQALPEKRHGKPADDSPCPGARRQRHNRRQPAKRPDENAVSVWRGKEKVARRVRFVPESRRLAEIMRFIDVWNEIRSFQKE